MVNEQKKQHGEIFFVEVKEPSEVKRNVLETMKEILELMQQFERFKRLRHEKLLKIQKLRSLVKDTNKIFGVLKSKLPQASFKTMTPKPVQRHERKPAAKKEKTPKEDAQKKHKTELDRLEAELSAIESKLKNFV